jgi:hypothetical protein
MAITCGCPVGAALGDITILGCPEDFGQIQKGAFQRTFLTAGTKNAIADPKLLASWTPLLAAADSTKVVPTPYINEPETEPGAAKTYGGGDNTTLGGVSEVIGAEPTKFTGKFLSMAQKTVKEIKDIRCENIGVWLFDEFGRIGCIVDDIDTPTEYYPVPIAFKTLFVGDKNFGGFDNPDDNMLQWEWNANYSDNFVIVQPTDFNPLTDLVAP